jgi:broad specificity phosphatase PhoE
MTQGITSGIFPQIVQVETQETKLTQDTNLTKIGKNQANDVFEYLGMNLAIEPDEIIYSPLSRAFDTALPFLGMKGIIKTSSIGWTEYNYKEDENCVDSFQEYFYKLTC